MKPPVLCLALIASSLALSAQEVVIRDAAAWTKIVPDGVSVRKLADGMKFLEGPVWVGEKEGHLIFSDIPSNELKQWSEKGGLTTFRTPSNHTNGNTLDREGRLISAEHSARRVSRTEPGGQAVTVVEKFDGKKFNSPNDVVIKSDGTFWFTDPPYGLPKGEAKEQEGNFVFRHDPASGTTSKVAGDAAMPNGLAFSPDEKKLYVADSGPKHEIWAYDVTAAGALANGRVFAVIDQGGPDGIRVDADGRVWSSAGDGVHVFATDGQLIGKILCPEAPANLAFGGADGKTLFMTSRTSLYAAPVKVQGASRPK